MNLQDIQRLQESTGLEKENQNGEETEKQTPEQNEDTDQSTEGYLSSGPTQRSMKRQRSRYPLNMMQACVECYQNFFHIYSTTKVLQREDIARQCMERLVCPQEGVRSEESDSVLDTASEDSFEDHVPSVIDQSNYQTLVPADRLSEDVITTFKHACKLLSEFSNFPIYCTDFQKALKRSQSNGIYLLDSKIESVF